MRQLWRLLLYLAAGAVLYASCSECSYFESDPNCGYLEQDFVKFNQSPELTLEPEFGVCGWSFDGVSRLKPRVDQCLSCSFTPAEKPSCGAGTVLVRFPQWRLAQQRNCTWQSCIGSDGICRNGITGTTASCPDGSRVESCCPLSYYFRCCSLLPCRVRNSPAGQCVVGEKDLLPGQRYDGRWFAVNTASNDCYPYSFRTTRFCQSDRTFAAENIYDSCETVTVVSRDTDGCAKLPGYTFHRGRVIGDAANWRMDDGTQWGRLADPAEAQRAAALDMPLMASRCSSTASCAAFQSTGDSTDLLYQLPVSKYWIPVNDSEASRCVGIYEKTSPQTSCPRIPGYLFIPMHTLDTNDNNFFNGSFITHAGDGPCANCSDSSALALSCETYGNDGACAGFSNFHGLITARGAGILSDQPLLQFTSTPCVGMFLRSGRSFPHEVEQLDQILCGEFVYCTSQLRYHASGQSASGSSSYFVDLIVDILTDFTLPHTLTDAAASGGLQSLPSVRSLVFRCLDGSVLLGGMPYGLTAVVPFLQELQISGCGLTGTLPSELKQFRYLQVLDLSRNRLTGELPDAWSSISLGYLNLSYNALTGPLPAAWRGIIKQQPAAPPPPPARATRPPPPAPAEVQQRMARRKMLVADLSGNQLSGAVKQDYVYDSCVKGDMRMQLKGAPPGKLLAELGIGGTPTFMLQYNPDIAAWSGRYQYAWSDIGGGSRNMCGSYMYKIALGILWGVFGLCLLAIVVWGTWTFWRDSRAERRQQFLAADARAADVPADHGSTVGSKDAPSATAGVVAASATAGGVSCGGGPRAVAGRLRTSLTRLWGKRWVRRVALLLRVCLLLADLALDIAVTVWLFRDGDKTSAAVCLVFIVATQMVVSAAVYISVAPHFFSSWLLTAGLAPIVVALGPVAWPVLAVGWLRNPDLPLVFWRYLELVEFCVALLQAPAQAVTQSIVYARQNKMGNGMYMDHGLFVASIILSMGDMLIAVSKLCRYKRGPLRRILVAVTHLDSVRDPVHYRLGKAVDVEPDGGAAYGLATTSAGGINFGLLEPLAEPLNPQPLLLGEDGAAELGTRTSEGGDLGASHSQRLRLGSALSSPPEGAHGQGNGGSPPPADGAGPGPGAVTPHTYTPLLTPRYRPLLAASAQRLSGSPLGPSSAHPITPSRLGPSGGRYASITVPAHPPLRALLSTLPASAILPVTPSAANREDTDASDPAGPRGRESGEGPTFASTSIPAQGEELTDPHTQQQPHLQNQSPGGGVLHGESSRGLPQAAFPASQPLNLQQGSPLLGGPVAAGVYGMVATGGHQPLPPSGQPPAAAATATATSVAAAAAAADHESERSSYRSSAGGNFISSSTAYGSARSSDASRPSATRPSATGPSWPPPPPPIFATPATATSSSPPVSSTTTTTAADTHYLPSTAAAAAAALANAGGPYAAGPSWQHPGPVAPAGLVLSPDSSSGPRGSAAPRTAPSGGSPPPGGPQPGAALLRRVPSTASSMPSANVSPARRREAPALSIAVPASPVQSQGIEVIRMSAASARHLSPQSSHGTVSWITQPPAMPPPLPPQLQQQRQQIAPPRPSPENEAQSRSLEG